jgi:hypothetical protein
MDFVVGRHFEEWLWEISFVAEDFAGWVLCACFDCCGVSVVCVAGGLARRV